jgi:rhamnulokinase
LETHHFLAFDLGAESGRTILGTLEPSRLLTRELTRFPNAAAPLLGHLHWNVLSLYEEIKRGMKACLDESNLHPESLGVDTWGVDFGLLGRDGSLLSLPYAYRDARNAGAMEEALKQMPRRQIYEWTGVQFLTFNTLFQLFAMARERSPLLESAATLLFMPDLFNYFLTGAKTSESTIASTSQFLDPRSGAWCEPLLGALGIPVSILPDILPPGTVLGSLSPDVARETGLHDARVVATAGHDTAAAIAAVPAEGKDWAYISSGTWSLMGLETREPIINQAALEANFTNEGGIGGTVRFLKNIAGLWLIQQCRKEWTTGAPLSYDEITTMAREAGPFRSLVDPDWPEFLNPPSMVEAIRLFCLRTKQPPPLTPAQTVRCVLESLALKYRFTLDQLHRIAESDIRRIHVIGGGSRNGLLCRLTADATGLPVIAGPAEATASGNILVQAMALGYVRSLADIRAIVRESVDLKTYEPSGSGDWERAYERFGNVLVEAGR